MLALHRFRFFHGFVDIPDHIERLLGQFVVPD